MPPQKPPSHEAKDHSLVPRVGLAQQGRALREAPGQRRRRQAGRRPLQCLDHARQSEPVQFLHHRHGQERDPRLPRGERGARRGRGRLHRRRRQGLLHRRQHQGIRRILRRQSAGIPRLYAAVQRHGLGHSRLRQAGDLPRQRHAHRRRPGNRHGLRFLRRAGSRALRPGRPQARLGADRRRHRLPPRGDRRRTRHDRLRAVRAVLRARSLRHGHAHRHRSGAESRRQVHSPTRWSRPRARSTTTAVRRSARPRPATRSRPGRHC